MPWIREPFGSSSPQTWALGVLSGAPCFSVPCFVHPLRLYESLNTAPEEYLRLVHEAVLPSLLEHIPEPAPLFPAHQAVSPCQGLAGPQPPESRSMCPRCGHPRAEGVCESSVGRIVSGVLVYKTGHNTTHTRPLMVSYGGGDKRRG